MTREKKAAPPYETTVMSPNENRRVVFDERAAESPACFVAEIAAEGIVAYLRHNRVDGSWMKDLLCRLRDSRHWCLTRAETLMGLAELQRQGRIGIYYCDGGTDSADEPWVQIFELEDEPMLPKEKEKGGR